MVVRLYIRLFTSPPYCLPWREQGDRLRLIRLDRTREDGGKTAVLELKNLTTLELVRLPFSYVAIFAETLTTDNRLYTLGQRTSIKTGKL